MTNIGITAVVKTIVITMISIGIVITRFHRSIVIAKAMIVFVATEMIDTTTEMVDTTRIVGGRMTTTMIPGDIVGIMNDRTVAIAPMTTTIPVDLVARTTGIPSIVVVDSGLGTLRVVMMTIMTIIITMKIIAKKLERKRNPQKSKKNGHHPFKRTEMHFASILVRLCFTNHCRIFSMTRRASYTTETKNPPISDTMKRKIHPLWRSKRWKRWEMQEKISPLTCQHQKRLPPNPKSPSNYRPKRSNPPNLPLPPKRPISNSTSSPPRFPRQSNNKLPTLVSGTRNRPS
mmetsp:Transcript_6095/g.14789  ORF Transcript_6095/g.14789 Transcript_6095/m.14789 type:complete len:288 (+) Transcript_6095:631-1494(+)